MCNTIIIDESRDVHRQFDKHVDPQLRLVLATCAKLVQYSHIRIRNPVLQQATEMCGFPYECRKSN